MHRLQNRITGLYAIADTATIADAELSQKVARVLEGGCRVLQYRDKSNDRGKRVQQASDLRGICNQAGAVFIINDDAELAMEVQADGVHCGKDDDAVSEVKAHFPDLLVGASCYNSLPRAERAAREGADYIAFGSFFSSATKPQAEPADIEILQQARQMFNLPVVAIGGIMAENAEILISSGASAVAVITGVFLSPDPFHSSSKIAALFENR